MKFSDEDYFPDDPAKKQADRAAETTERIAEFSHDTVRAVEALKDENSKQLAEIDRTLMLCLKSLNNIESRSVTIVWCLVVLIGVLIWRA